MKRSVPVVATVLAFVIISVAQQHGGYSPALVSLVEAERAFARTSVERGVRESFLAFFADDGINFQPHPTVTREAILKRPAPATRPPVTLNWEPIWADVSRAGDLGYTTGPYILSDQSAEHRPSQYGYYFSIWKRQPDGAWKVAVDVGVQTPAPDAHERTLRFQSTLQPPSKKGGANVKLEAERLALLKLDREFIGTLNTRGASKAYPSYLGEEARVHRDGLFPLTDKDAIRNFLAGQKATLTGEPIKSEVAQSNDLGYTYGRYELAGAGAQAAEKGYYVRVWKRDPSGRWKIALDTTHPLPPEQK